MRISCGFSLSSLPDDARQALRDGLSAHETCFVEAGEWTNLAPSAVDAAAEIVFGQPDPEALAGSAVRWVHLTSAGYARYDAPAVRNRLERAGVAVSTSSGAYADPCAEHTLAMMLAMTRRLPACWSDQRGERWAHRQRRGESRLLRGARVVILGYGAIARRLIGLLSPFNAEITVVRRALAGDEGVRVVTEAALDEALATAEHLIDTLPGTEATAGFVSAARLRRLPRGAFVYNLGRGTTLDTNALLEALTDGSLAGAYLDVTEPEPLPPGHPLWSAPGCHLTPHAAGGRREEHLALVELFLTNLARYERGEPLLDRVI